MQNPIAKSGIRRYAFPFSIILILFLGFSWKAILLGMDAFPFNADEAIVGLMGRHILEGARPIFFYGQAYMGSLDAFLVAAAFRIFGVEVDAIRWVQVMLYLGTVLTTMLIAMRVHRNWRAGLLSGLLLAFPTLNFTLYTTVSLGGYGESLLIGNMLILLTLDTQDSGTKPYRCLLWGLLAGLGFWAFGLTIIYIIPCGVLMVIRCFRNPLGNVLLLLGLLIGLSPVFFWFDQHGTAQFADELLGSAIAASSPSNLIAAFLFHLKIFLIFGPTVIFGFRAPWSASPQSLPLLPFAISFWSLVLLHMVFRRQTTERRSGLMLLGASSLLLLLGFLLTPFGADPSGRYFVPLMIPLSILAGEFVLQPRIPIPTSLRWILLVGVLAFQMHTNLSAASSTERISSQFDAVARVDHGELDGLIEFLTSNGITRGYSNYWVAYPLAFRSGEALIFYPALPYHHDFRYTHRDNRIPAYEELVESSAEKAFITTKHELLDKKLRQSFSGLGLKWEEALIGDYRVFYNLSGDVNINQIGSDWLNPDP